VSSAGLTPIQDAWLRAQQMTETFSGFTADEINAMSMDEFARLSGRSYKAIPLTVHGDDPEPVPESQEAAEPKGVDIASMDMATYAQFRQAAGIGVGRKEGRGIFDSASYQAQLSGARAQAGRTALSNGNVVEPPRLTGRYMRQDDMRDTRSAAERFSTPGNSFYL
jgi:hypothetical protein